MRSGARGLVAGWREEGFGAVFLFTGFLAADFRRGLRAAFLGAAYFDFGAVLIADMDRSLTLWLKTAIGLCGLGSGGVKRPVCRS